MGKRAQILTAVLVTFLLAGCGGHQSEQIDLRRINAETTVEESQSEGDHSGIVIELPENQDQSQTDEFNRGNDEISGGISSEEESGENQIESGGTDETEAEQEFHLLFSGDVLLSDHVLNAYQRAGGISGVLDQGYRDLITNADYFMVNEEFPFSNRGTKAQDKQYTFRLAPEKVSMFQELGIDAVTLANNHALDYGTDALLDSCEVLDQAEIAHTGAGKNLEEARKPVQIEVGGKRIAVIGATRVIPQADWSAGVSHPGMLATYDPTVLLEEIRKQKQENDYVFVMVHWGIERDERPQEYQRTLGKQYIDAGADLVIGSHPHVLQGVEYYKGKAIVYSLGNFIFGSSIPRTALLEVSLPGGKEDGNLGLRLISGTSKSGFTQMFTGETSIQEFVSYMQGISYGAVIGQDGRISQEE
ncbi:CapA family protein [Brotaphodocola sp.]|uniref:CapA family protein n=1 Tax=Brotaphodocola sp. TaxID=3073577 RepID=UPI003D7DDDBE